MSKTEKYVPISQLLSRRILVIIVTTTVISSILMLVSTIELEWKFNSYFVNSLHHANESIERRLGKVTSDSLYRQLRKLDTEQNTIAYFPIEYINRSKPELIFYNIVIDSVGNYIYHHDRQFIGKGNFFNDIQSSRENQLQELTQAITSRKTGVRKISIKGNLSYIYYMPVEGTNWTNAILVPYHPILLPSSITRVILFVINILGFLVVYRMCHRTVRHATAPLRLLTRSVANVAKGNFTTPLPEIWRNNEVRLLRDSFVGMQSSIVQYIDQLQAATVKEATINRDLETAEAIQMSMIPKEFPVRPDADIYGSIKPAMLVGGDFYDFFIKDDKLFFCIGDVSGKGIPAALFMMVHINLFRAFASEESRPERIVSRMNNSLSRNNPEYMFVTCFVGILDLTSGLLQYCNAGHTFPYIINKTVEVLPIIHHPAVGAFEDIKYEMQEVVIAPQTTILLYTDGLNEATNADNKEFGDNRIVDVLNRAIQDGQTTSEDVIERMNQAVRAFVGDAKQSDDLTMLCVRLK